MVRHSVMERIGLLDDGYFMYSEDTDYCHRARLAGSRVVYLPSAELTHVGAVASAQAFSEQYVHATKSMLRYFKKFHSPFRQIAFRALLAFGSLGRAGGLVLVGVASPRKRKESAIRLRRQFNMIRLAMRST